MRAERYNVRSVGGRRDTEERVDELQARLPTAEIITGKAQAAAIPMHPTCMRAWYLGEKMEVSP